MGNNITSETRADLLARHTAKWYIKRADWNDSIDLEEDTEEFKTFTRLVLCYCEALSESGADSEASNSEVYEEFCKIHATLMEAENRASTVVEPKPKTKLHRLSKKKSPEELKEKAEELLLADGESKRKIDKKSEKDEGKKQTENVELKEKKDELIISDDKSKKVIDTKLEKDKGQEKTKSLEKCDEKNETKKGENSQKMNGKDEGTKDVPQKSDIREKIQENVQKKEVSKEKNDAKGKLDHGKGENKTAGEKSNVKKVTDGQKKPAENKTVTKNPDEKKTAKKTRNTREKTKAEKVDETLTTLTKAKRHLRAFKNVFKRAKNVVLDEEGSSEEPEKEESADESSILDRKMSISDADLVSLDEESQSQELAGKMVEEDARLTKELEFREILEEGSQEEDEESDLELRELEEQLGDTEDQDKENDSRSAQATQAVIQRRRRPKRRSTGVVHFDMDEVDPERPDGAAGDNDEVAKHTEESDRSGRSSRLSSVSSSGGLEAEDSAAGTQDDASTENGDLDYKKLYEESRVENERLRLRLRRVEDELRDNKSEKQSGAKSSMSEAEKRERRAMERKLSEMEEELKQFQKLKAENEKLKAENRALTRVVSKLSQTAGNLAAK